MKTAKEYLESRTAEIGAAAKKLAVKTWFNAFFAGLDTELSANGNNIWLVTNDYGIEFDLDFTGDGVKLCRDYMQENEWQEVRKFHFLYVNFTPEGLVEELEKIFVGLVQKLTR